MMRTLCFLFVLAAAITSACSSPPVEPPVAAAIAAATPLADGGISVAYDARSDGQDVVLALVLTSKPEADVASTVLVDFGPERTYVFPRSALGEEMIHRRLELTAVIRKASGETLAVCRVR